MLLQNCFRIARRLSPIAGGSPPLAARLSSLVAHRWWFAALARRSSLAAPRIGITCDASVAHGRRPSPNGSLCRTGPPVIPHKGQGKSDGKGTFKAMKGNMHDVTLKFNLETFE